MNQVKLELTSLKINNIKNDIDNIQNRIDNIEERLIFGRISQSRCDELSIKLIMEKDEKERRNTELMNDYLFYQYQIQEIELSKEIDLEKMTISDKIDIINKVIDIISFKRIDSHKSIINIYNKFNKRVIVYQINTYGKTLGIKLEDRLEKTNERPKKNFRPKKMWSYNYKGELIKGVKTL